jgi:hypothetical protein
MTNNELLNSLVIMYQLFMRRKLKLSNLSHNAYGYFFTNSRLSTLFSMIFLQPIDNQYFMKCKLSVFS